MKDNKCVYVHKDKEGVVRYVGSGTVGRAYLKHAESGRGKKYSEYVKSNGKLEVEIVAVDLTKIQSEDLERELYDNHIDTVLNVNRPSSIKIISKELLDEFLYYDETSSTCLRWKVDRLSWNGRVIVKAGSEAGSLAKTTGYYRVYVQWKNYLVHRVVAILHGLELDGFVVDHIDRDKSNNKISNLRVVSQKENNKNRGQAKLSSNNTSGVQGVFYNKCLDSWIACWMEDGKSKMKNFYIKNFISSEEAFTEACRYRKQMTNLHHTWY